MPVSGSGFSRLEEMDEVDLEFRVKANVSRVYSVITEPRMVVRWIEHPGTTTEEVHGDLRVGGQWHIRFRDANGEVLHAAGEYLALEQDRYLEFLLQWDDEVVHTPPFHPMRVRMQLEPDGDGTYVRLWHGGLASITAWQEYAKGWERSAERLRAICEEQPG